jgi:hypothetical protein
MGSCENKSFDFFLRKFVIGDGNLLSFEDSLFGHLSLDLIICNNKITQLEKCMDLAYFFHCPVLVIDHETKPSFLSQDIISMFDQMNIQIWSPGVRNISYILRGQQNEHSYGSTETCYHG